MKFVLRATSLALFLCACGKGSDSTSTTPSFTPYIDFTFPDSVTTAAAELTAAEEATNVLESQAQRLDRSILFINGVMSRLNSDGVTATGEFSGKGPSGELSGYVEEMTGSSAYRYQAIVCQGGAVVMHFKWSADGQKIHAVRDLASGAAGQLKANMIVQIDYDANNAPTLDYFAQGQPYAKPSIVTSGQDFVIEHVQANRDLDGSMTIKGTNDWYAAKVTQFRADTYLTGTLNSNGSGSYVAYRKFNTVACPTAFNEANLDSPGWCLGRDLDSDTRYTAEQRVAAWASLKNIGIESEATLTSVTIDPDLQCTPPKVEE